MTEVQTMELIDVVKSLTAEQVDEVRDFVLFLKERYAKSDVVDYSDEWSDEDLEDFSRASFADFEKSEQEGDAVE